MKAVTLNSYCKRKTHYWRKNIVTLGTCFRWSWWYRGCSWWIGLATNAKSRSTCCPAGQDGQYDWCPLRLYTKVGVAHYFTICLYWNITWKVVIDIRTDHLFNGKLCSFCRMISAWLRLLCMTLAWLNIIAFTFWQRRWIALWFVPLLSNLLLVTMLFWNMFSCTRTHTNQSAQPLHLWCTNFLNYLRNCAFRHDVYLDKLI